MKTRVSHRRLACGALTAICIAPAAARGQSCEWPVSATKLTVIVENVRSNRGQMTASIYPSDKSQYLIKNGAIRVWRVPAQSPATSMCIWLKTPGVYAVAVYHDANGNGRLDRGPFGPTEAYGFSRNPRIFLSPPGFDQVKFTVSPGENTIHVRLHNP